MKLYVRKINDCQECPSCGYDDNITRYQCIKSRRRFIAWISSKDEVPIPEWCPLPDCDLLNEKDFEIG